MKRMKERAKMADLILSCLLVLLLTVILPSRGVAQITAFTYQGKLTDSGNPANGNYDLQFKLFDALSGGAQQGSTLTNPTVQVAGGIFNVNLDFGSNVFTGTARFLEISVRPAGSPNPYTVLSPRQPITSSPYAIQTLNAQQLGGLPASRYVTADPSGNVGIGVANPDAKLAVTSLTNGAGNNTAYFSAPNLGPNASNIHYGTTGDWYIRSASSAGKVILQDTGGNVGIGTGNPTSKLEIAAQDGLGITGFQPFLTLRDTNSGGLRSLVAGGSGDLGFYPNSFIGGTPAVILKNGTGNVGIGVGSPTAKLQVAAGNIPGISVTSQGNAVIGLSSTAGFAAVYGENTSGAGGYGVYGKGTTGDAMFAEGNARQSRNKGGFVKAMVYVNDDGTVLLCYNGLTGSASGNCGFSVTHPGLGTYYIDFGFQADDRFVSITPVVASTNTSAYSRGFTNQNTLGIGTYQLGGGLVDTPFYVILF